VIQKKQSKETAIQIKLTAGTVIQYLKSKGLAKQNLTEHGTEIQIKYRGKGTVIHSIKKITNGDSKETSMNIIWLKWNKRYIT